MRLPLTTPRSTQGEDAAELGRSDGVIVAVARHVIIRLSPT